MGAAVVVGGISGDGGLVDHGLFGELPVENDAVVHRATCSAWEPRMSREGYDAGRGRHAPTTGLSPDEGPMRLSARLGFIVDRVYDP